MRTDDLDYDLPRELVAQEPPPRREEARLLVLDRETGATSHRRIPDLPELVHPGDVVVVNDTRVLAARLFARRATGGRVEVFLVRPLRAGGGEERWEAAVRAGGRIAEGERLETRGGFVRVVAALGAGRFEVAPEDTTFAALMETAGKMPLPPYIRRDVEDPRDAADRERYQTVYARRPGAVAAPTAGLHLGAGLLDALRAAGAQIATVTLHVGLGTFLPVRTERLEDHVMHEERWDVPEATARAVRAARAAGRRILAVGTTSVRALESAAAESADGLPRAGSGATSLYILPGYRFRAVDALLTNFHLPRSTLLGLVCAFAGREPVLAAYREAIERRYRFHSYGDAMLVTSGELHSGR